MTTGGGDEDGWVVGEMRVAGRWASIDRARGQLGVHTRTRPCGEDGAVGRRVAGRWASIDHALVARGWTRRVDPMHAGPNLGWQVRVGRGAGILKDQCWPKFGMAGRTQCWPKFGL